QPAKRWSRDADGADGAATDAPASVAAAASGRSSVVREARLMRCPFYAARGSRVTRCLKDRSLAPSPPDPAQRVAHLPHRHVVARAVDDEGHEIDVLDGSRRLQLAEQLLHGRSIAARPHGLYPLHLLALQVDVDLQQLRQRLVRQLVAVDAHDDAV